MIVAFITGYNQSCSIFSPRAHAQETLSKLFNVIAQSTWARDIIKAVQFSRPENMRKRHYQSCSIFSPLGACAREFGIFLRRRKKNAGDVRVGGESGQWGRGGGEGELPVNRQAVLNIATSLPNKTGTKINPIIGQQAGQPADRKQI